MPKHGNLSAILVTQRLISIEMANMKQQLKILLDWSYRPDLWPVGHPKFLQVFTFWHCICLSWDIHTSNFQNMCYENQMSRALEKGMFLECFDFPWGGISIYALYRFLSPNTHTACEHPPQCLHLMRMLRL